VKVTSVQRLVVLEEFLITKFNDVSIFCFNDDDDDDDDDDDKQFSFQNMWILLQ
jgi:hypothetical protein